MTFGWPGALLGLLIVPALAALYWWAQFHRRRYTLRYSSVTLVRQAMAGAHSVRRHIPAAMYILAIGALMLALSRPKAVVATPQSNGVVILVLDISGSMRSNDVAPDRIDAAEAALRQFVSKQPSGVEIGLVTFGSTAQLVVPPTRSKQDVLNGLRLLQLQRGTNIGDGLDVAFRAIVEAQTGEYPTTSLYPPGPASAPAPSVDDPDAAMIVLLSDGAATLGPPPLDVAAQVGRAHVKTYTVGIGTSRGGSPSIGFGGNMQMDEPTMRGIASATGGQFFAASDAGQLQKIYGNLAHKSAVVHKETELTFAAAGAGMLLMVVAGVLGTMWSNRLP